jgi:hypothetical protein
MSFSRSIDLVLAALIVASSTTSTLASPDRAPADVQKRYDQFITEFRAALKANNAAAVASMTAFPLFWIDLREEASFQKQVYPKLFTRKVRDCIGRGRSVYQRDGQGKDSFSIFCGDQIFSFAAQGNGFRFNSVDLND